MHYEEITVLLCFLLLALLSWCLYEDSSFLVGEGC